LLNQNNPCQEALKEKTQLDADKLMEEIIAEVVKIEEEKKLAEEEAPR
jgi:hypothetical protein